jgi:hypothetical protein
MLALLFACTAPPAPATPEEPVVDHAVIHDPATPEYTDCFVDADGDGWGGEPLTLEGDACTEGSAATDGDCDDTDALRSPAQSEVCDGLDNDCDQAVDSPPPTDAPSWYADADGDGFGDPGAALQACEAPAGYVSDASDCDDRDATAFPGGAEICEDGLDNDCTGDGDGLCRVLGDWAMADLADATWSGEAERDQFGSSVAAFDLDSDGLMELFVGGWYTPTDSERQVVERAFAVPLAGGAASDADLVLSRSNDDADVNYVPSGALDDIDGDGCRELVVGGYQSDSADQGAVWVFNDCIGSITEADAIAVGVEDEANSFGGQVAVVDDSDGDGAAELLVSARGHAKLDGSWRDQHGRAYLFLDPLNELDAVDADVVFDTPADAEWMSLGTRVCSADFDGDGLSDAAMSAPGYGYGYATLPSWGRGGAVFVAFAPFAAQTDLIGMDGTPGESVLVYTTSDEDGMLGYSLACGGDLDGDGLPELLIGDEYEGRVTGRVYVQSPRTPGSAAADSVGWYIDGSVPGDTLGRAMAAGDLDGDGRDDLAVVEISGDPGVIDIFYGGSTANRTSADADARIDGPYALALGDFNGDGIADIAAGQATDSTFAHWSGAVSIILGGNLEP